MSGKPDNGTEDVQDEDNNEKRQPNKSEKHNVSECTHGDNVVDDEQFEKNFEENKKEIAVLLAVFDAHSHLMKALTAIQLWGHILDGKCAMQKIIRPLTPVLRQMEKEKELESPLPNPRNLSPEDTKQLRKLWDKTNNIPAPTGLEALAAMKEKMKYDSFRDMYLTHGRKIYFHFKLLNPTMNSNALKDKVIQEFGKCESKRDLERAFDEYEKKRRRELGLKNSNNSSNNNNRSSNSNRNRNSSSSSSSKGNNGDDHDSKDNENKDKDDGDKTPEENELAQASSPSGRSGLRKRSKLQQDSLALACVSPSPSKKKKKTKTTKTTALLWDLTAPKLNQKGKLLDPKWLEVAQSWVFVVLPFFELILNHCENAGKTKFNVSTQHSKDEQIRKRATTKQYKASFDKEKEIIVLSKFTLNDFYKLQERFDQLATEQFHITESVSSSLISIGMIDANAETEEDTMKSLKVWIPDKKVRIKLYQQINKICILIRLKKTSEFIKVVNEEVSVDREHVVATIKRIEGKAGLTA